MSWMHVHTEALADLRKELRVSLLRLHGPVLIGAPLAAALRHQIVGSLRQALRRGQVLVPLFAVPNCRGLSALTLDVADWLAVARTGVSAGGRLSPK